MGDEVRYSYIARKHGCGCVVGACHDDPDNPRMTASLVADLIRQGCYVERAPSASVADLTWGCPHGQKRLDLGGSK